MLARMNDHATDEGSSKLPAPDRWTDIHAPEHALVPGSLAPVNEEAHHAHELVVPKGAKDCRALQSVGKAAERFYGLLLERRPEGLWIGPGRLQPDDAESLRLFRAQATDRRTPAGQDVAAGQVIRLTATSGIPIFRAFPKGRNAFSKVRIMKVVNSLKSAKRRHKDCRIVRRKGRAYIINKSNPRYKARQG